MYQCFFKCMSNSEVLHSMLRDYDRIQLLVFMNSAGSFKLNAAFCNSLVVIQGVCTQLLCLGVDVLFALRSKPDCSHDTFALKVIACTFHGNGRGICILLIFVVSSTQIASITILAITLLNYVITPLPLPSKNLIHSCIIIGNDPRFSAHLYVSPITPNTLLSFPCMELFQVCCSCGTSFINIYSNRETPA